MHAIQTQNLTIGYAHNGKQLPVYHNLQLLAPAGQLTCLLGLNGAGKSTLLRTLAGFLPPLSGDISLFGKPLSRYSQHELARTIGVVLTDKFDADNLTVYDLVALGRHPYTGFFGRLRKDDRLAIDQALHDVAIDHKAYAPLSQLSDGERQKTMIAKALAQQCPLIILDEPTAFLDVLARIDTLAFLAQLASQHHKSILLSSHDLTLAFRYASTLWLLHPDRRPPLSDSPLALLQNGAFATFFRPDIQASLLSQQYH
jgi:iron complex transport system ATP-binding protein